MPRRVIGRAFGPDTAGLMAHVTSQFLAPLAGSVLLAGPEHVLLTDHEVLGRGYEREAVLPK